MSVAEQVRKLTEADYLALERAAEFKSEFYDGEMFAMAGGSPMRSLIGTNVVIEFGLRLKGRLCVPFNADLRIKVEQSGLLTYPDLSVICGPLQFAAGTDDTVTNPTLLAEVLSDSTENYDRATKFDHYKRIPSLREYLLVRQREPVIEHYIRQKGADWLYRQAAGMNATLAIPSLEIMISLSEVFANVKFVPTSIRPQTPRPL